MSRLTHFNDSPDVAGKVSLNECKLLTVNLKDTPGGSTFLPISCTAMLKHDEDLEKEKMEDQNARVYRNLKKRNTYVAKADYPPTAC